MNKKIELCNLAAVCAFYGKSQSTILRWVELGIVPRPCKYQGKVYWKKDELKKASERVEYWKPKMSNEGIAKVSKANMTEIDRQSKNFNRPFTMEGE